MLARIHWKKVVSRGEQYYQITKLENFKRREELPEKYTSHTPMMEPFGDAQHMRFTTSKIYDIEHIMFREGSLLTRQEKENIIHWMKICGQRLASINKTLAIKNADWTGEGFDEI